jgi:hypothetical protein
MSSVNFQVSISSISSNWCYTLLTRANRIWLKLYMKRKREEEEEEEEYLCKNGSFLMWILFLIG